MTTIPLVWSEISIECGMPRYVLWDIAAAPHMAVSGITGTGKTYLVKLVLARLGKHIPNASLTVCDFKGDKDFAFLSGCKHFYRFEESLVGFKRFYEQFLSAQRNGASAGSHFVLFEEWASFLNYLDKKECEEAKKNLASLLMLGRSFDFHVILSQQRLDAESFGKSRDNLNLVINLGNPSKEVQGMLFNDFKDKIQPDRKRGTGFLLENNCNFQKIVVPTITNMPLVEKYIREAVER